MRFGAQYNLNVSTYNSHHSNEVPAIFTSKFVISHDNHAQEMIFSHVNTLKNVNFTNNVGNGERFNSLHVQKLALCTSFQFVVLYPWVHFAGRCHRLAKHGSYAWELGYLDESGTWLTSAGQPLNSWIVSQCCPA